jgi:hypothetical protein
MWIISECFSIVENTHSLIQKKQEREREKKFMNRFYSLKWGGEAIYMFVLMKYHLAECFYAKYCKNVLKVGFLLLL